MTTRELKNHIFVAVVEDNMDPKKIGRCKCRVLNVFDDLPTEDIPWASPWKDLNGNQFILPDKGKVVSVVFDEGNMYKPEYICSDHYNINLEKKLSQLPDSDYVSMRALMFDHKTQIYSNDSEGLKIDYKFNNINIKESTIDINLKDNFGTVNIGSAVSDQSAILGDNFLRWMDKFMYLLVSPGGFLDSLASPILPTPDMIEVYNDYVVLKPNKFLSKHVKIVDNEYVSSPGLFGAVKDSIRDDGRIAEAQVGDNWKSTVNNNNATSGSINFGPQAGLSSDSPSGQLTTSGDGSSTPTNIGPIDPSTNPDAITIIQTMSSKGYKIYTRPYEMNIVGIRRSYEGMAYSNAFTDTMYLIYKIDDSDKWEIKKYRCSTMPGYFRLVEGGKNIDVKQSAKMQARNGQGILKPAQYIDVYAIGVFPSSYGTTAMVTLGPQKAYRDKTTGPTIKYTDDIQGYFGMFIHRGYPGGVNNWSEGCQIFQSDGDLNDFFKWCQKHKEKYGNKFSYTLMEERSLVSAQPPKPKADKKVVSTGSAFFDGLFGISK